MNFDVSGWMRKTTCKNFRVTVPWFVNKIFVLFSLEKINKILVAKIDMQDVEKYID